MTEPEDRYFRIARDVADHTPVEWERLDRADAATGDTLERFRTIERIVRAYRVGALGDDASGIPDFGGDVSGTPDFGAQVFGHDAPGDDAAGLPDFGSEPFPVATTRETAAPVLFDWGPLRVRRALGEGGFAEVFGAWDPTLEREVALKLRRTDGPGSPAAGLAWLDEARRLARVRHPNVLQVYGADIHDGRAGLWTELVRGRTLEALLQDQGTMSPREATLVGLDLCAALAAVHAAGLLHGDVKTRNVMRAGDPTPGGTHDTGRIVLMDFGAARETRDDPVRGSPGTPLTSAPEVLRGEAATRSSDIYSLGVLLYRLVSGRYPIEAASIAELSVRLERGERTSLRAARPDLPRAFVDVVERATALRPGDRFAGAAELERALSAVLAIPPGTRQSPATRRRTIEWTAVLAVSGLALGWYVLDRGGARPSRPPRSSSSASVSVDPGLGGPPAQAGTPASPAPAPASPGSATATGQPPGATHAAGSPDAPIGSSDDRPPLSVEATLFQVRDDDRRALRSGDRLAPGDRLFLETQCPDLVYFYLLNEDASGSVHVLFPLKGSQPANPLAAGIPHRLPHSGTGGRLDWLVTTANGRETFLLLASRSPLAAVDSVIAHLPEARRDEPVVYATLRPEDLASLRGVGGLSPETAAAPPASGRLAGLAASLGRHSRRDRLWIRSLELENPAR